MSAFKVLIIGSGLGGLSLAQSLHKRGIDVEVYERDKTAFERPQGYRLHLDADAINAVDEVLPKEAIALFHETSYWTAPYTSIMDLTSLKTVKRFLTKDDHGTGMWAEEPENPVHANVDRATLRQILLSGLDNVIHFSKKLDRYESTNECVTAFFADGSTATGTVLVGADGMNSIVRRQRAPNLQPMDAGITAIYGRLPLDAVRQYGPKEALEDIFIIGSDHQRKTFLGLGSVIFPNEPSEVAKSIAPGVHLSPCASYGVCIVGGRHEFFPNDASTASSPELREIAARVIGESSSNAASLVRAGDSDSFFVVKMRSSVPGPLSRSPNVTLLGDAIHGMTPSLGRGANLAMRHGALLARHLARTATDEDKLDVELAAYEDHITSYGFQVVREAAKMGQQRMDQNPLSVS